MHTRLLLICLALLATTAAAQDSTSYDIVVEDSSLYRADYSQEGGQPVKGYATLKVQGLSPNKLITVGYDYQAPFTITSTDKNVGLGNAERTVQANHGLRLGANVPIISKSPLLVNLGFEYAESRYQFARTSGGDYALYSNLQENTLRNVGLNLTVFKPLNIRHFILGYVAANLAGNYNLDEFQPLQLAKPTGLLAFGWKRNERSLLALGITYTWRIGEPNIIPVVVFYHTLNPRWGLEFLAPARMHLRYTVNARTLLLGGYELEGQSYTLRSRNANQALGILAMPELRKSELRARLVLERELYQFIWFSLQAGVRINLNYNLAEWQWAARNDYVLQNRIGNPLYVNLSLHLVSF